MTKTQTAEAAIEQACEDVRAIVLQLDAARAALPESYLRTPAQREASSRLAKLAGDLERAVKP